VRDIPVESLVITEGSLVVVELDKLGAIAPQLTPSSRSAIATFLGDNRIVSVR
jgi:hypothetical protein